MWRAEGTLFRQFIRPPLLMPAFTAYILSILSLALFTLGVLLFFEVVRPFRDLDLDMPIAIGSWSAGIVLAGIALWFRLGHPVINWAALTLNVLALAVLLALVMILKRSGRLF